MPQDPPEGLKPQAPLRSTMMEKFGLRDWSTLAARTGVKPIVWQAGQRAQGRYLDVAFNADVLAARCDSDGFWHLTLRFDLVTQAQHGSFRQQLDTVITPHGESPQKMASGAPLMMVRPL